MAVRFLHAIITERLAATGTMTAGRYSRVIDAKFPLLGHLSLPEYLSVG
jgi:hypothetical protein